MSTSGGSTGKPEVQTRQAPGSRPPVNLGAIAAQQWERDTLYEFATAWGWTQPGTDGDRIDHLVRLVDEKPEAEVTELVDKYRTRRPNHLALWPIEDNAAWIDSREAIRMTGRTLGVLKRFATKAPMLSRVDPDRGLMFDREKLQIINASARRG